jgi:predicted ester cyclase
MGRVKPTGRRIEVTGMTILQIRDGQVVDTWGVTDELTGAEQLGLLRQAS